MAHVDGKAVLELPRAEVWGLLNDPEILGASIPGCRGFERDGDAEHRYRTAITVAVGAVKGIYEGTVAYADVEEPERCTIVVSGRGDKGGIEGRGAIELRARDGSTEVAYRGDFKLTGPIAGVGQRLAPGISRKMIVETLRNLERRGGEHGAPIESSADRSGSRLAGTEEADAAPERDPAEPAGQPARRPSPEAEVAFEPISAPPWALVAGGVIIGLFIGVLIRRRP